MENEENPEEAEQESESEVLETDAGENEEEKAETTREDLIKMYEDAVQEKAEEEQKNRILQAKLVTYFVKREFKTPEKLLRKSISEQEEEYKQNSDNVECILKEISDFKLECEKNHNKFVQEFSEKELDLKDIDGKLEELRRAVALRAVHSGSGERIPKENVSMYLTKLKAEEGRKREIRLVYLKELKALGKTETQSKVLKTQRSMTINDYELMIADTNLNNCKAMEKKRELVSLQTSCLDAVNVITHLKHELHFLQKDKEAARSRIGELEEQVNSMTKELLAMKVTHETTTKLECHKLRKQFTMVQDDTLPDDYEYKKAEYQHLTEELNKLKRKYHELAKNSKSTTNQGK